MVGQQITLCVGATHLFFLIVINKFTSDIVIVFYPNDDLTNRPESPRNTGDSTYPEIR